MSNHTVTNDTGEPTEDSVAVQPHDKSARKIGKGVEQPFVSPSMRLAAAWSWRAIVVGIAFAALLWLLGKITVVVVPVLIAMLIAALLAPLQNVLIRWKFPRVLATVTVFVGFIIFVLATLALVGQQITVGFSDLWEQILEGIKSIGDFLADGPFGLDSNEVSQQFNDLLQQAVTYLENNSGQLIGGAAGALTRVGTFMAGLLICLFATFFFLLDGRKIFGWVLMLLPTPARPRTEGAFKRGWQTLVQYVRVQVLVAGIDAIGIGLGAFLLGVPLAVPLTILVFMASFVPIVGAIVTGFIAVILAFVTHGWVTALIMLGVVLAVQQIEGNVLQPFIMGKAVSVHPLAVVLAVSAASFQWGIAGALFAVPFVAVLNTIWNYYAGRDPFDPDQKVATKKTKGKDRPLLRKSDDEPIMRPEVSGEEEVSTTEGKSQD